MSWFADDIARHVSLSGEWVVPEPTRCVQCGICSFNCPVGIDVRRHVWLGEPVIDGHCLTCSECVKRCPRGVLRFQRIDPTASARGKVS
jgi:NAD-dependent dihydropyrimidine dehydrogenase PreA subunit